MSRLISHALTGLGALTLVTGLGGVVAYRTVQSLTHRRFEVTSGENPQLGYLGPTLYLDRQGEVPNQHLPQVLKAGWSAPLREILPKATVSAHGRGGDLELVLPVWRYSQISYHHVIPSGKPPGLLHTRLDPQFPPQVNLQVWKRGASWVIRTHL